MVSFTFRPETAQHRKEMYIKYREFISSTYEASEYLSSMLRPFIPSYILQARRIKSNQTANVRAYNVAFA